MSTTPDVGGRDIAIVGMACLYPGADSPARFWANICAKLEFVGDPLPAWDADRYLSAEGTTHIPTARGGFLGEAYTADVADLGVMPSSVDGGEPDQFLALAIAKAALADAGGLGPGIDHTRTGIILGHSTYLHRGHASMVQHGLFLDQTRALLGQLLPGADPALLDRVRAALKERLPPFNADVAPGLVPNVMTGRIANRLDLRGPNYIIDAACSSSLLAVQAAMEELRGGRSDLMLAGGVNASIAAEVYMVFNQLGALAESGRVRPFCEGGDGTLMGEGLGILALRRLEDALADGQRVYAVLKGVGQSSDGRGGGLLAPRLEGEMLAIERAIEDAAGSAEPPGLIEAHGTGIQLGDRTEVSALARVYGGRPATGLPPTAIGSVKSMIGHTIPAAGAAGLIKASLALYHRTLPPMLGEEPRAELGFEATPLYVSTEVRPWIAAKPRRAAVNAFGFGGVNAHAILEEAPGAAAAPAHWPSELVLLSADTVPALAARANELVGAVRRHPSVPLGAIAADAAGKVRRGPCRLAVVAADRDDLLGKLEQATRKLEEGRGSFRTRSGVFAGDAPLDGKLAFVFPGEGAQYQGMLGEILTAFPEAREWFDFWDALFPDRDLPPSASVFPPPTTLDPGLKKALAARLFGLELGSESVFIAAQALLAVTRRLGLQPDVVVGHSSGEHSALAAAGVLGQSGGADDRAAFAESIRSLNRLYHEMEAAGSIPGGGLLTVGGVERDRVLQVVEADPDLHLALDNCQHQAVIYGPRPRMEEVAAALKAEGGITAFLPFDRPYHTPLFAPVAERVAQVYAGMDFRAPGLPVWSCATAAPMPDDPGEIRALTAKQWASRVRFTETVERLHDEGVRLFLEVGPSANLTGFIDDALKGREALAVALDSRRRGSLSYLLQSLGQVWVSGRDFAVGALFEGRGIEAADLDAPARRRKPQFIDNTLPFVRLPDTVAAELSAELMASLGSAAPAARAQPSTPELASPAPVAAELAAPTTTDAEPPSEGALPTEAGVTAPRRMMTGPAQVGDAALGDFFAVMRRFLDAQGNVMEAASGVGDALAEPVEWAPPLLHRVVVEDGRLRAESDFDPLSDPFIAQHLLYARQVSDVDPTLQALPVLPLACSMEMVVEAAAVLTGAVATRLEAVRARDWVAFDHGPATIVTEAALVPANEGEPESGRVAVRLMRGDAVLFEAEAVLGDEAADEPLSPLVAPQAPIWQEHELYTTGMFHGPLFQGVARLLAWDATGIDAELAPLPLDGFMAQGGPEGLLLNPALLDQVGHVTAFWIAQGLGTDFSCFPSSIARIDLTAAREEATSGAVLSGRLSFRDADDRPQAGPVGARFLQGDFDCTAPDGRVLLRVRGWRDRFLRVPNSFYNARYRPRDAWYGGVAGGLFPDQPDDVIVWSVPAFPHGFLEDAGGLWTRVLVATVLSAREREAFRAMTGTGKRRREWLTGRIALKEAARAWLLREHGVACLPADIEIEAEPGGRPTVSPGALAALGIGGSPPEVSLAHAAGAAVAAVGGPGRPLGIDMEVVGGVAPDLLAEGAFTPAERVLLGLEAASDAMDAGRLLTGWCAKEAAAKATGKGLNGRPRAFTLKGLIAGPDQVAGRVQVETPEARSVEVALARAGDLVMALAVA